MQCRLHLSESDTLIIRVLWFVLRSASISFDTGLELGKCDIYIYIYTVLFVNGFAK